jgi:hypothetical protein
MKHSVVFSALLSSFLISSPVLAKAPDWNFLELGYAKTDVDEAPFEPSGYVFQGSRLIGESVIFAASYSDLSGDVGIVDIDLTQYSIGLGYRSAYSDTTDFFGILSYENVDAEASLGDLSEGEDEGGIGVAIGVRTMIGDKFELSGNVKYIDIAIDSETTFGVDAYYYLTDNLAIGAGYTVSSDANSYGASLRYNF